VIGEPSTLLHERVNPCALDLHDLEHDEPVVEEQRIAGRDVVRQILISATDRMLIAALGIHRHVEHELPPFDEQHVARFERLDANLGAL
jgi:hypothetical protein